MTTSRSRERGRGASRRADRVRADVPIPISRVAVGLLDTGPRPTTPATELPCDGLRVEIDGRELFAVNMVVLGVPPDAQRWSSASPRARVVIDRRVVHDGAALAVVIASGQYLRGNDVVPRGHPGDGRAEVQVYASARGERRAMRERLPLGVHLPHPRIRTASGRRVEVQAMGSPRSVEVDGAAAGTATDWRSRSYPAAFTLLV